jgi:adenine-specific DNA-methyltransferase
LEEENFKLLEKLINNAENITEALQIAQMGIRYEKTGLRYQVKLDKINDGKIHYLKKNDKLSFDQGGIKHKLIIGDNYHALLNLLITHKGKIDVIYIDPPYGCNDMGEFANTNYTNEITRDNLLSMLEPRLELAKMLLSETGVIFCSIDDKNQAYFKCLFDKKFGEKNFICNFI